MLKKLSNLNKFENNINFTYTNTKSRQESMVKFIRTCSAKQWEVKIKIEMPQIHEIRIIYEGLLCLAI